MDKLKSSSVDLSYQSLKLENNGVNKKIEYCVGSGLLCGRQNLITIVVVINIQNIRP